MNITMKAKTALSEISAHLINGIVPFWLTRGVDSRYGGFLTCFDENGNPSEDTDKYIVTQTRMIWGFSALIKMYPQRQDLLEIAKQGVDFLIKYFWDKDKGGWFWKTRCDGTLIDDGKVVYGQTFAIYALSEYYSAIKDTVALEYAEKTFDLLQIYCTDTERGGYFENLEKDWRVSAPGFCAGDRKSLDIHMHMMEALTLLAECTKKDIHMRKLNEVTELILNKMVNKDKGCGLNQFDLSFNSVPAINIRRTWNAEREASEVIDTPLDTTSYGHNVELSWLLNRAGEVMGKPYDFYNTITEKLVNHSLRYGFDHELGGVYRDGPHDGYAIVHDKEWWQNAEVLVGYLDSYERLKDEKYFDAFYKTWIFDQTYMIDKKLGEWHQLVNCDGKVLVSDLGNPWKAFYHTGRSMMECMTRLKKMIDSSNTITE